MTYIFELRYNA